MTLDDETMADAERLLQALRNNRREYGRALAEHDQAQAAFDAANEARNLPRMRQALARMRSAHAATVAANDRLDAIDRAVRLLRHPATAGVGDWLGSYVASRIGA